MRSPMGNAACFAVMPMRFRPTLGNVVSGGLAPDTAVNGQGACNSRESPIVYLPLPFVVCDNCDWGHEPPSVASYSKLVQWRSAQGTAMAYKLPVQTIDIALKHLCRYGDTDIFPHLPEIAFFSDRQAEVVGEIAQLDLDSHTPSGAMESLAPKSRYGFRVAHQLGAVDTLLLLGCVVEIGEKIEARRQAPSRAFSYRFSTNADGQVFAPARNFKAWLQHQADLLEANPNIIQVLSTDISDFYSRVNYHRLENYLDECAAGHGAARFIKKHIKVIRAKQSFGLPVGGAASRLLAELSLCDTDRALLDGQLLATRYVDDFRIFLRADQEPYDALASLAEQLGINEGLALNVAKTEVTTREHYSARLQSSLADVKADAESAALDQLMSDLYSEGDPDPKDIENLSNLNLLGFLDEELGKEHWDIARIKLIFSALRVTRKPESIEYILANLEKLLLFSKQLVLLMEVLEHETAGCFNALTDRVIGAALRPPASSVHVIQAWMLELFVRGVVPISIANLTKLSGLQSPLHRRQVLLIRGRLSDSNYFRSKKTAVDQFSSVEQPSLVWGAACLPTDEFSNWLPTVKGKFKGPCAALFCDWVLAAKATINTKLGAGLDEHPD
ncbi:MAG: RNA-directed DNA polymerase [Verrucomicrobiaceae bacterium]|nr:MAG: RNA-directed DNA polymerase [Verrucomicrobiaceae bacterium]